MILEISDLWCGPSRFHLIEYRPCLLPHILPHIHPASRHNLCHTTTQHCTDLLSYPVRWATPDLSILPLGTVRATVCFYNCPLWSYRLVIVPSPVRSAALRFPHLSPTFHHPPTPTAVAHQHLTPLVNSVQSAERPFRFYCIRFCRYYTPRTTLGSPDRGNPELPYPYQIRRTSLANTIKHSAVRIILSATAARISANTRSPIPSQISAEPFERSIPSW